MDSCKSDLAKDGQDPSFLSGSIKTSNTAQSDFSKTSSLCNCDFNGTQGVCEHEMYDDEDDEETNNNVYPPDELDILGDEFDSNRKDYNRRGSSSDFDSANISSEQVGEGCNLSVVYQGEWPLDRMYWNEESDGTIASSLESNLHPDTASIMSFDSSMTTSSVTNQISSMSDQSNAKADVVYTLLSMLHTHDKMEVSEMLLSMSSSRENCIAMIESGCLPLLVQLLHDRSEKITFLAYRQNAELRKRASKILHNIVFSQPDDKKGRREARVLRLLEQVREYCDFLKNTAYNVNDNDDAHSTDQQLGPTVAALMKLSFDEEHRHAMCLLGGLQAIAELMEIDQEVHGCINDQYCIMIRRYSGMALTNLTFGDGTNKSLLCSMKPFMQALVAQLYSPSEELRQVSASVLRNLSWRADPESKLILREVGAVTTLMKSAMEATRESTLKSILSALWNLSAHCSENKADICSIDGALGFLVGTLTYKSSSKNLAVVENGGGILRNISSHIAIQSDHRITLRKHNCLQILLRHLKSPSLTVVSNACGTLWNLSARNAQDQRTLWEMGAVGMLKKLINSKHKMISMGSSAALKNLLSAMPPGINSGFGLSLNDYNSGMPSLHVRKQKILNAEIDQNLAETYDNTDSPKSSPTFKKKAAVNRRAQSAPVYRHGIPLRISSKAQVASGTPNVSKPTDEISNHLRYDSTPGTTNSFQGQTDNVKIMDRSSSSSRKNSPNDGRSSFSASQKESSLRADSPNSMRPYSYPAQRGRTHTIPNTTQSVYCASSSSPFNVNTRHHSYSPSKKILPMNDSNYSKFSHRMKNMKYDEPDCQELPVDYSLKYSEESSQYSNSSKSSSESKIPLPKSNNGDDSCRPSASVSPLYISPKQGVTISKTNMPRNQQLSNSFECYTETDLDDLDQVVDYSQKYKERKLNKRASFSQVQATNPHSTKSVSNCEDTVKVYCTEDTPVNFSSSSSLTNLCDINSVLSQPQGLHSMKTSSCHTEKNSVFEKTTDLNEKSPVKNDKEGKNAKTCDEQNCAETPLMFSRCSSLGSLSSFEQPSIQDDRSSVSDFSHMTSGIISPSDLPDSPSQTMPPSPNRKKQNAFIFGKRDHSGSLTENGGLAGLDHVINEACDEVQNVYALEGTPVSFSVTSSLSSLSIENDEGHCRASLAKDVSSINSNKYPEKACDSSSTRIKLALCAEGQQETIQRHTEMQKSGQSYKRILPNWEDLGSNFNHSTTSQPAKTCGFADDTIKVYNTEGTPNLSHSASFSDLSMLSFCAERNPSLEISYPESESSFDDGSNPQLMMRWQKKDTMIEGHNASFATPSLNNSQEHSDNSSVCEENHLHSESDATKTSHGKSAAEYEHHETSNNSTSKTNDKSLLLPTDGVDIKLPMKTTIDKYQHSKINEFVSEKVKDVKVDSKRSVGSYKFIGTESIDLYTSNEVCNQSKSINMSLEEPKLLNSQLVEGTPISFSRNSSLSSLSIESADEHECAILKTIPFDSITSNLKKSSLRQSQHLQKTLIPNCASEESKMLNDSDGMQEFGVNHNSPAFDNVACAKVKKVFKDSGSDKIAYYEKALLPDCIQFDEAEKKNPTDITLKNVSLNAAQKKTVLNNSDDQDPSNKSKVPMKCHTKMMIEDVSNDIDDHYFQDLTKTNFPINDGAVLQNCNSYVMPDRTSTNSNNCHPDLQIQEISTVKSNHQGLRNTGQNSSTCIKKNENNFHVKIEEGSYDNEEALLQKCILAGMPKPKNVDMGSQQYSKVETATQSKNASETITLKGQNCIHSEQSKEKSVYVSKYVSKQDQDTSGLGYGQDQHSLSEVTSTTVLENHDRSLHHIFDNEDILLQKCISAGMPKSKKSESVSEQCSKIETNHQFNKELSSLSENDLNEAKFSESEEALLQKCILAGMPKPKNASNISGKPFNLELNKSSEFASMMQIQDTTDSCRMKHAQDQPQLSVKSMPAVQSDFCDQSSEMGISDNEEALLQKCILAGMPKPKNAGTLLKQSNRIEKSNQCNNKLVLINKNNLTECSDNDETLLQKCILAGMPKPKNITKQLNKDETSNQCNKLSTVCKSNLIEPYLSNSDEVVHQKVILPGMLKVNNINDIPVTSKKLEIPEPVSDHHQCIGKEKILHKTLFSQQMSKRSEPNAIEQLQKQQPSTLMCQQRHESFENREEKELSDSDEALLQKYIIAGMPKPKEVEITSQTSNALKANIKSQSTDKSNKVLCKTLFVQKIANNDPKSISSDLSKKSQNDRNLSVGNPQDHGLVKGDTDVIPNEIIGIQNCIAPIECKQTNVSVDQLKKHDSYLAKVNKIDFPESQRDESKLSQEANKSHACISASEILKQSSIDSLSSSFKQSIQVSSDITGLEPLSVGESLKTSESYMNTTNNISENGHSEPIRIKINSSHNCEVTDVQSDLALEAQRLTDDMLEAVVDGTEDMTVSTLSCMSEIENVTPPSVMGELSCLSLTNSFCGDDLKSFKSSKLNIPQKKTLLKELQLSHLGSDLCLPIEKYRLSHSTLSLNAGSSNADLLENVNPPSAMDISLTASIGSLDSFHSDILDGKSVEKIHPSTDYTSMNERFYEAAAMVEMYAKEFSNITGVKNLKIHDGIALIQNITDVYEDVTEPACDTIASDIDIVDELPCDEDDFASETLLAPQLSSLNKDEPGEGSIENLTLTLTEETPVQNQQELDNAIDTVISDDFEALKENADLILNSLKKVHISESSDFGILASNDLLEDETLSLVSNESDDDDSFSPEVVFGDGQTSVKSNGNSSRSGQKLIKNSPVDQTSSKCHERWAESREPSDKSKHGLGKFGFVKNASTNSIPTDKDSCPISNSEVAIDSSISVSKSETATMEVINTSTFTRKKSTSGNIPSISDLACKGIKTLKSPTYSSRESIDSCSTSNSMSSLSSCGDVPSSKSNEKKKMTSSKIGSIWKSGSKLRSKSIFDPLRSDVTSCTIPSNRERSLSPALQRFHSQSSSPQSLSRSSTDEKINENSFRRPTTLMLPKQSDSPKLGIRRMGLTDMSDKHSIKNSVPSPVSLVGKSILPGRKSMIPTSSKIGTGAKTMTDTSSGKQKPCMITMV